MEEENEIVVLDLGLSFDDEEMLTAKKKTDVDNSGLFCGMTVVINNPTC